MKRIAKKKLSVDRQSIRVLTELTAARGAAVITSDDINCGTFTCEITCTSWTCAVRP